MKKVLICDGCAGEFQLMTDDIKQQNLVLDNKQLSVTYFCCPICQKVYIIQVLDDDCKILQKDYIAITEKFKNNPGDKRLYTKLIARRGRLEKHMKDLKKTYGEKIEQHLA